MGLRSALSSRVGRRTWTLGLTCLALVAFAGNSLIGRQALRHTPIDPANYTLVRLASGAAVLALIVAWQHRRDAQPTRTWREGHWISGAALFAYAVMFSYAYGAMTAATGTLLLFPTVQITMIGWGWHLGERLTRFQTAGLLLAAAGLLALLWPGLSAPPWLDAMLMMGAGAAWGVYSLRGRGALDPTAVTAGNFWRAAVLALVVSVLTWPGWHWDAQGVAWAMLSGGVTSGCGYALWYLALRGLKATTASVVQLGVPVLVLLGGAWWLGEPVTVFITVCAAAVIGGIAMVLKPSRA